MYRSRRAHGRPRVDLSDTSVRAEPETRFAARFLLKLSPEEVRSFFDVFFDCPPWVAKAFLSNVAPASDVAQAMSAVFGAVDWSTRARMARASLG